MDYSLWDTHCHLGWFSDPARTAREAEARGLGLIAVTVTPAEYRGPRTDASGREKRAPPGSACTPGGFGSRLTRKPWSSCCRAPGSSGEVGTRRLAPARGQLGRAARPSLSASARPCAETSDERAPAVLSIHAVRAATPRARRPRAHGGGRALPVACCTGSPAARRELWRAARLGCRFSFGERALATGRGREYARGPARRPPAHRDRPPPRPRAPPARRRRPRRLPRARRPRHRAGARRGTQTSLRRRLADNAAALLGI